MQGAVRNAAPRLRSPLGAAMLFNERKPGPFIEMPRGVKPRKSPEVDTRVFVVATKVHGSVDQLIADALAAERVGEDEPSEMRSRLRHVRPVDGDTAFDANFADRCGRVEGGIAIDGAHVSQAGAHLRWFILSDALRGQGVGNQLINAAMDFCRNNKYPRVYLWTFAGLHAARHLYERAGFSLVEQHRGAQWGTEVEEQRFELHLA